MSFLAYRLPLGPPCSMPRKEKKKKEAGARRRFLPIFSLKHRRVAGTGFGGEGRGKGEERND